jgi:two-component system, cell cycle sensor histidine kinase and response regulator CckA
MSDAAARLRRKAEASAREQPRSSVPGPECALAEARALIAELEGTAGVNGAAAPTLEELRAALERVEEELEGLRRGERRYRAIFENAAIGIRLADVASGGVIVEANDAFHRLLGYEPGEVAGRTFFELTHPDDREENRRLFREVVEGRLPSFQMEKRYLCKDGRVIWGRLTASPLRDSSGKVTQMIGLVQDITRRKEAEAELQAALLRNTALLQNAVDAILTIDARGTILTANPAVERLFGYTPEELLGEKVNLLMPSPYQEEHDGYLERYLATGEKRIIGIGREVWARRKDGTVFPIDLAVSEVMIAGERTFMGTIRDITQRKEAEEALRQERDFAHRLVETAHAIVLVLDLSGRIVRYNRYTEELTGYSLEEVQGQPWVDVFLPEREQAGIREVLASMAEGARVRGRVNAVVTRNGTERLIEWYATPMRGADDEVSGVLAVGLDVTERLQLEEQFRQAQKMEAIGRLAGSVAHDFNTVLASILGYSEVLLEELGDAPIARSVRQIHRGAQRGAVLTRQLLALSRRQKAEAELCEPDAVIADLREMLVRLIGEGIQVRQRLAAPGVYVRLAPGQLEQILLNLVVNARDAISGKGQVTLRTRAVEIDADTASGLLLRPGSYLALSVSDTGCGMDEEVRGRIFDPFFTTKAPDKGTGLGLSTVYGIVQQAGGQIRVDTAVRRGSTFSIFLPRAEGTLERPVERSATGEVGRGTEVVLLVEDDEMFRGLLTEVLRGSGYRVLAAATPLEALELAADHAAPIDLLLSDLMLPEMTGVGLARRLVLDHPEAKVVLMSGYSDPDAEEAIPDGVPLLQKPFNTKDLLRLLRDMLGA